MSLVNRTYTFTDGTTAYGSQLESEIQNIVATMNNLDAGSASWDMVKAVNSSTTPLVADNSSGSNNVLEARVNGVTKFYIDGTGNFNQVGNGAISNASSSPVLFLNKTNSGVANQAGAGLSFHNYGPANTTRVNETVIGEIDFACSQPTSGLDQHGSTIKVTADGDQTGTNTPTKIQFYNTDASNNVNNVLTLYANGIARVNGLLQFASTSTQGIQGTLTNDGAATGNVGEFVDSSVSSLQSAGSSGQFANVTSVALSAGDWDVSGNVSFSANGATFTNTLAAAISAFSNNTTTDHVAYKNVMNSPSYPTSTSDSSVSINRIRISVASPTTVYLKGSCTYSVATPKFGGYITARRVR